MGLDITFSSVRSVICPHCGKSVGTEVICSKSSGGRGWYPILKSIGYYVPYDRRTEENDWYGKDMVLTDEQVKAVRAYIKQSDLYYGDTICGLLSDALLDGHTVVINADW